MRGSIAMALFAAACDCGPGGDVTGGGTTPDLPEALDVMGGEPQTCQEPLTRSTDGPYIAKDAAEQPIDSHEAQLLAGGLAVEDYDGDGWLDMFLPSDDSVQMWFGVAGADFDEEAATALVGIDLTDAVGATNVDYDADGDIDLLVLRWEKPTVLLRNDGARNFVDATAGTGLDTYSTKAQSASWADIDLDGDLDLFIGSYGEFTSPEDDTCDDHVPDPHPVQLWVNNGDGTFTDARDRIEPDGEDGLSYDGYVFASGFYDLNEDGYPELFTANDDGKCAGSKLYQNQGGARFAIDDVSGGGFHGENHDMGMAVGSLNTDEDELPDFAFTSYNDLSVLVSLADAEIGLNGVVWIESAQSMGVTIPTHQGDEPGQAYGWGTGFGDVDNDGDLDLGATFGYWSIYTGSQDPMIQPDGLWVLGADGQFTQQSQAFGVADTGIGRGMIFADLNNDGYLDLVKRQLDRQTPLYLSNCGEEAWLEVRLLQGGPNLRAIGAKIRVFSPDGTKQIRWMTSGSEGLYTGTPLQAHFGLADADLVDVEVVWPDGKVGRAEGVSTRQQVTLGRVESQP